MFWNYYGTRNYKTNVNIHWKFCLIQVITCLLRPLLLADQMTELAWSAPSIRPPPQSASISGSVCTAQTSDILGCSCSHRMVPQSGSGTCLVTKARRTGNREEWLTTAPHHSLWVLYSIFTLSHEIVILWHDQILFGKKSLFCAYLDFLWNYAISWGGEEDSTNTWLVLFLGILTQWNIDLFIIK